MEKVDFFGHSTGRLIVGGNPFTGFTYIPEKITREDMLNYYTAENMERALFRAEELGYTAFICTTDDFTCRVIRQYRNNGGRLDYIAQTHVPLDFNTCIRNAVEAGAIAIFHQGTHGDGLFEDGKIEEYRENINKLRQSGLPCGLATHRPEVIEMAEREGFDTDFYMACLHNNRIHGHRALSSSITGVKLKQEFFDEDRPLMLDRINKTKKPCIAYKILAGGNKANSREEVKNCFLETYRNIKDCDLATVGMFVRDNDQLLENREILDEVLTIIKSERAAK